MSEQLNQSDEDRDLDAIRERQEMALIDTGELLSDLVDHPERTDLLVSRMGEAEERVDAADRDLLTS